VEVPWTHGLPVGLTLWDGWELRKRVRNKNIQGRSRSYPLRRSASEPARSSPRATNKSRPRLNRTTEGKSFYLSEETEKFMLQQEQADRKPSPSRPMSQKIRIRALVAKKVKATIPKKGTQLPPTGPEKKTSPRQIDIPRPVAQEDQEEVPTFGGRRQSIFCVQEMLAQNDIPDALECLWYPKGLRSDHWKRGKEPQRGEGRPLSGLLNRGREEKGNSTG